MSTTASGLSPAPTSASSLLAQRGEEAAHAPHAQVADRIRQHLLDDLAVLERIAGTRGRLRAIGQHPPAPVGRARQIGRVQMQPGAVPAAPRRGRARGNSDDRRGSAAAPALRRSAAAGRTDRRAARSSTRARCATPCSIWRHSSAVSSSGSGSSIQGRSAPCGSA